MHMDETLCKCHMVSLWIHTYTPTGIHNVHKCAVEGAERTHKICKTRKVLGGGNHRESFLSCVLTQVPGTMKLSVLNFTKEKDSRTF